MELSELRSSVRYMVFGDSTETTYADADLDRNLNLWYKTAIGWVMNINGDWQVKGDVATTNLIAGQNKYFLPSDILKLNQVYVKIESGGEYLKAKQVDPQEINTYDPDGDTYLPHPPRFDLFNNYLKVYTSNKTIPAITAGLKVHYQTEITELENTTDSPDLSQPFQKLLILGASYEYCIANEMRKAEQFKRDINELRVDLERFYSRRSEARRIRIIPEEGNLY